MKIVKARIRGLGSTIETEWFELCTRLNLFNFSSRSAGTRFVNGLQTINPPYSCHGVRPFRNFPNVSRHRGYLRRINPKKRTIAMAVFAAPPALVGELAANSDLLYEVDRIEVGRRLDYSRWINFVELASTTRWNEIATDIDHLFLETTRVAPHLAGELRSIIDTILPSDRVKGELKESLLLWLHDARQELGPEFGQLIDTTRDGVMRADYFQAARNTVCQRLPLFLAFGSSPISESLDQLVQWLNDQPLHHNDSAAPADRTFLDDLNHQLSRLHTGETPLQIDYTGGVFSIRDDRPRSRRIESSPGEILENLRTTVCLAISFCRTVCRTEPILLFDSLEALVPAASHSAMIQFIFEMSNICQCLYVSPQTHTFFGDSGEKIYSESMLIGKRTPRTI